MLSFRSGYSVRTICRCGVCLKEQHKNYLWLYIVAVCSAYDVRKIRFVCAIENVDQEICKIFLGLHTVLILVFTKCMNGVGHSVELRATRQKSGIRFPTKRGIFLAAKVPGPTHCCTCMVGSGGYAAGLWSSLTTCLDLYARIRTRAWSFGCGMGDHGRIPCCSMFRPILGQLKLTILQILGGAQQSRCLHLYIALPCLP